MDLTGVTWGQVLTVFAICAGASVVGAIALLIIAARQISSLDIPEDADFFETLQIIPITVPLALDLLDLAFDIFAAPIAWIVLELLGLRSLQLITVFEGLIPGTQLIPTMTIAWVLSRTMPPKKRSPLREALADYQQNQLGAGRLRRAELQDRYRSRSLLPPGERDDVVEGEYFEEDYDDIPPEFIDNREDEW